MMPVKVSVTAHIGHRSEVDAAPIDEHRVRAIDQRHRTAALELLSQRSLLEENGIERSSLSPSHGRPVECHPET